MELRQLQTFVTITQTESFSRAAEVLGLYPVSPDRADAFWKMSWEKLFDRMGKRVYLTALAGSFWAMPTKLSGI